MTNAHPVDVLADVSRETLDRLEIYSGLLKKWTPKINLVSASTLPDLWTRHFLDSAQILSLAPADARVWADLGTGGGFPGLVVAILAHETRPHLKVTCVESDQRKATFLRTVLRETGVSAKVVVDRIENADPIGADVVSARALAPLGRLLDYADRHLSISGVALFLKGAGFKKEVAEALERWSFQLDTYPSTTDPEATILKIGDLRRV